MLGSVIVLISLQVCNGFTFDRQGGRRSAHRTEVDFLLEQVPVVIFHLVVDVPEGQDERDGRQTRRHVNLPGELNPREGYGLGIVHGRQGHEVKTVPTVIRPRGHRVVRIA